MKNKKAAIGFIFVTLLIDVIGFGLIIPVVPTLIQNLMHAGISEASRIGGWLTSLYSVLQFLFAPILGRLSDQYGRRPVLLFSLFGFAVDYLFLFFAPSISWLFVGRAISGITGASFTTASAYIADISTDEDRTKNFGIIGAAFGMGFVIGPMIGGLLGKVSPTLPFLVASILSFANWLYGYFILPESLPKEKRRPFSWAAAIPGQSLVNLKKYKALIGLIVAYFFVYLAAQAVQTTWSFFTIEKFGWDELMIGVSLAAVGILTGLVQGLLVRKVNARLGNERSINIGFLLYTLALFLFAFASQSWMMFVFIIPYCLGGISQPALQSFISGNVNATEQGEVQGALTSLVSLTSIIGPPLMTGLFSYFTSGKAPYHFSGAPFLLGAVFMLIAAGISYYTLHHGKYHNLGKASTADNLPIH